MIKILCMEASWRNFIPETLKKPIDDLTKLFTKLRKDKKFLEREIIIFQHMLVLQLLLLN